MQENTADIAYDHDHRSRLLELIKSFAFERRAVTLASGQKSDIYIDCRQVYFRGEAQFILGELFYQELLKLEETTNPFDVVGGMAMGSIPLSCATSMAAFRRGRELPGFAVRKEAKEHGMLSSIEGGKCLSTGTRALIVEDVVTTGSSAIKAITALREQGVLVDTLFSIVDREQGGKENLMNAGVKLFSLFKLKDVAGA